jgi:Ca2+-dependent lipid-binding protein
MRSLCSFAAVYEETCVLLLTADEVKSDEALSLMLWDSDEHTSDDLIGRGTSFELELHPLDSYADVTARPFQSRSMSRS